MTNHRPNRRERRAAAAKLAKAIDFKGRVTESWLCVDCGMHTAPGVPNRAEMEKAAEALGEKWHNGGAVSHTIDERAEMFMVQDAVWKAAGMAPMGGCLCIRCLEKRIGRELTPKDFPRWHPFNDLRMPGTALRAARLLPPPPPQLIATEH